MRELQGDRPGVAAASDLPRVGLADALGVTVLLTDQRELFERLAIRWVARFAQEVPDVRLRHVYLALASLGAVRPGEPAGAEALAALCSGLGRDDLVAVLEDWLDAVVRD